LIFQHFLTLGFVHFHLCLLPTAALPRREASVPLSLVLSFPFLSFPFLRPFVCSVVERREGKEEKGRMGEGNKGSQRPFIVFGLCTIYRIIMVMTKAECKCCFIISAFVIIITAGTRAMVTDDDPKGNVLFWNSIWTKGLCMCLWFLSLFGLALFYFFWNQEEITGKCMKVASWTLELFLFTILRSLIYQATDIRFFHNCLGISVLYTTQNNILFHKMTSVQVSFLLSLFFFVLFLK